MLRLTDWTEGAETAIDAFVGRHPAGLIYYTPAYRRFLLHMLDCRCESVVAWRGSEVVGVLPLMSSAGPYGTVVNSLPFFGSNGGVLAESDDVGRSLSEAFDRRAGEASVASATWISNPFVESCPPRHDVTDERIAQWTDLTRRDPATGLPAGLESSSRRNIGKAIAEGVRVRKSADALDILEKLHRANMGRIGGREKPAAFFAAVRNALVYGRDWRLYVAERAGIETGALLLFFGAKTVEYVMPGIAEDARHLQPTAVLIAHAMRDAIERGYERWNLGGTWLTQDNVYRFKRKWGAQERRYRYFVKINNSRLLDSTPAELASTYPGFYCLPYAMLNTAVA